MQFRSFLAVAVLLTAACASDPAPTEQGATPGDTTGSMAGSSGSSASGPPATTSPEASTDEGADDSSSTGSGAAEPIALDRAWVEGLEGAWLGPVTGTPLGDLPQFFWEFEWTEQDSLLGVADSGMGFRFEFEFSQQDGEWTLTETGTLPGDLTQSDVLHPVSRQGDLVRFEVLDRPGYLVLEILAAEGSFEMAVQVRGEPHGAFDLAHPR